MKRRIPSILISVFLFAALLLSGCATVQPAFVVVSPHYESARIQKVALIGITDYQGMAGSGESAASIFEKYLLLGGYSLVERRQVSEVLKEQSLQANGTYDQATLKKLGQILGVSGLVFGSLTDFSGPRAETVMVDIPQSQSNPIYGQVETIQRQGDTLVKTTQNVVTDYNYTWTSQIVPQTQRVPAHAGLTTRLVDVSNGEVLWSGSASSEGNYLSDAMERASSKMMEAIAKQIYKNP
jgi:hypothetical protein